MHFAEIDINGNVLRVIVADQAFIDSGLVGDPKNWIQTESDGTRKNYAGPGYVYNKDIDAFVPPKPHESFILDTKVAQYIPSIPFPKDGKIYTWDESNANWKLSQKLNQSMQDVQIEKI